MKSRTRSRSVVGRTAMAAAVVLSAVGLLAPGEGGKSGAPVANRYIGASKCKSCHSSESGGNQYGAWMNAKHSKAYETLATEEAKKVGAEHGAADPQKSDACLKCHTTAFGEPADMIKKGFKVEQGVQCETCHGPGEMHLKARFAAAAEEDEDEGFGDEEAVAYAAVPAGEIIVNPPMETCKGCHNEENPNFERFCYYEHVAKVRHLDPRKPRSAEDKAAMMVCGCGECACVNDCSADCAMAPK